MLFTDTVVIVSIVILVALFSMLGLWFIVWGSLGNYDIAKHDIAVLRAINPTYIYYFFKKNCENAWSAHGGCVLCVTGKSFYQIMVYNHEYCSWII